MSSAPAWGDRGGPGDGGSPPPARGDRVAPHGPGPPTAVAQDGDAGVPQSGGGLSDMEIKGLAEGHRLRGSVRREGAARGDTPRDSATGPVAAEVHGGPGVSPRQKGWGHFIHSPPPASTRLAAATMSPWPPSVLPLHPGQLGVPALVPAHPTPTQLETLSSASALQLVPIAGVPERQAQRSHPRQTRGIPGQLPPPSPCPVGSDLQEDMGSCPPLPLAHPCQPPAAHLVGAGVAPWGPPPAPHPGVHPVQGDPQDRVLPHMGQLGRVQQVAGSPRTGHTQQGWSCKFGVPWEDQGPLPPVPTPQPLPAHRNDLRCIPPPSAPSCTPQTMAPVPRLGRRGGGL